MIDSSWLCFSVFCLKTHILLLRFSDITVYTQCKILPSSSTVLAFQSIGDDDSALTLTVTADRDSIGHAANACLM